MKLHVCHFYTKNVGVMPYFTSKDFFYILVLRGRRVGEISSPRFLSLKHSRDYYPIFVIVIILFVVQKHGTKKEKNTENDDTTINYLNNT